MSIPVFKKMAKPSPLLFGNPKATVLNLGLWFVLPMVQVLDPLLALVLFGFTQVYVAYKTYRNIFFLEEMVLAMRGKNRKAMTDRGEIYV